MKAAGPGKGRFSGAIQGFRDPPVQFLRHSYAAHSCIPTSRLSVGIRFGRRKSTQALRSMSVRRSPDVPTAHSVDDSAACRLRSRRFSRRSLRRSALSSVCSPGCRSPRALSRHLLRWPCSLSEAAGFVSAMAAARDCPEAVAREGFASLGGAVSDGCASGTVVSVGPAHGSSSCTDDIAGDCVPLGRFFWPTDEKKDR